jgi:hypothetical protein
MSFETVSEEGQADYEVWTCDKCGYSVCLDGVGGDVSECPQCLTNEIEAEILQERAAEEEQLREEERRLEAEGPEPWPDDYFDDREDENDPEPPEPNWDSSMVPANRKKI